MTWLIVWILLVIVFLAVKSSRKHLKGEGGCCCGGASVAVREETKELTGELGGSFIFVWKMPSERGKIRVSESGRRGGIPMIGQPKFKREAQVKFEVELSGEKRILDGVVYVVDPDGTREQQEEPSYDIETFLEGEVVLFKHIRESLVSER